MSVQSTAKPAAFALKFIVGFAILTGGFEASRGTGFERFVVEDAILMLTACVTHLVFPRAASNSPAAGDPVTTWQQWSRILEAGARIALALAAALITIAATQIGAPHETRLGSKNA